ncbi:hypothetical protein Pint_34048 [Pistacia integerrima]|uniref:Uncharacterized protein n=1 Tax=Pistacia integerrima TaxID=434235 RepID=A0ACC0X4M8_9ROSI|nr:hypothetical protein Pint_34048 [Pistacia integerrima]
MVDCKPISTPFLVGSHLTDIGTSYSDATQFRSLAGALQYLTLTRPNLSYSVNFICQYMHAPTVDHFRALKRILRYVKGTYHYGLQLSQDSSQTLLGYSDADWANCPITRRSTTRFAVYLGHNLISWCSKKQTTLHALVTLRPMLPCFCLCCCGTLMGTSTSSRTPDHPPFSSETPIRQQ